MEQNQHILLKKLDEFIRKFYKNRLLKGVIYTFTIVFLFFISIVLLEYFGNFSTQVRSVIFFSFVGIAGFTLYSYIILPLLKLNKLGKFIDYETAAEIIGNHFESVKDKLLNTLQLIKQNEKVESELVGYSINQKISELKPVPFSGAIDFSKNKKYLKYAAIPLFLFLVILFVNARIIKEGTTRIVNYNQEYIPEAPFRFLLQNENLDAIENEDFELEVKLEGDEIPNEVILNVNNSRIKLRKKDKRTFAYTFKNIQSKKKFFFEAAGFNSKSYEISPIIKPVIMGYSVTINYPSHTNIPSEKLENTTEFSVPSGTSLTWDFKTKNTKDIKFNEQGKSLPLTKFGETNYTFQKRISNKTSFALSVSNEYMVNSDSLVFNVSTIKDQFPLISVSEKEDSLNDNLSYFSGNISDDYGFSNLEFKYRKLSDSVDNKSPKFSSVKVDFNSAYTQSPFYYLWDKDLIDIKLGETIEYYFQVWDNDKINGYKSARTSVKKLKAPTKKELEELQESKSKSIKEDLEQNIKKSLQIQEEIKKMTQSILNKTNVDWQDKKKMKDLLNKQKEVSRQNKELLNKSKEKNKEEKRYNKQDKELEKKQEKLEKLMEELNNEEMKKLMEKLEKMMEKMDKSKLQKSLEELNQENIDLKKEMERTLELFKQMEMDEKLEEFADKMEKLAEKQEELSEKEGEENNAKEQEKLNEEFKEAEKQLDELKKKNEDLENKKDLDELEQEKEEAKDDMKDGKENLEKGDKKGAQQKQKDAAENMKAAAKKARDMQSSSAASAQENMEDLRALLENLLSLSFDQEEVLESLKRTNSNDPRYVKLGQRQVKIKDDARLIEDSLLALSKRIEQIKPVLHKEMNKINDGISNALAHIGERRTANATQNQQLTMTSVNNLALLLDEALKQMQNQQASSQPGGGSCNNPGGSNPKPGLIPSMQKAKGQAGQGLEKLQKKLGEKGKPTEGEGKNSEELAKMAAEQAMLRKAINELSQELNKDGSGLGNELKKIEKQLEEVEEDIVNDNITQETINRQREILTRLLESEKALREREYDEKRESNTVKNPKKSNPNEFLEYKRKKEQELELLKTIPPSLRPYYKNRVNDYFNQTK